MIGPRSFKRNFDANNYSTITYWEKKSGGDKLIVKIASQPAQSFGGWKRIKVLKFPSTHHERTLKSSQTLKHPQFKILHCLEKSIPLPENWNWTKTSDCKNLKFFEEQEMVRKCRSAVTLSKSCSWQNSENCLMLTIWYVDWIGKYTGWFFLTVPPNFHYQNEKWWAANQRFCTKDPRWLKNVFLLALKFGRNSKKITLYFDKFV